MAISKSKNKRNLAKRKLRKQMQLKAEQLHNAVVIAAMTNTYEKRLNELLRENRGRKDMSESIYGYETNEGFIYSKLKENDISRIN